MLPHVLLVFALLIGFFFLGKWFLSAEPRSVKHALKWVFPGVELVLAIFFRLTKQLMRLDFPTFDRPAKATSLKLSLGI